MTNGAGGGLFVRGLGLPSTTLSGVGFSSCSSTYVGGALAIEGEGASLSVFDSEITDCEALHAGGAYISSSWGGTRGASTALFDGVAFTRCTATHASGQGGAIRAAVAESLELARCYFEDNAASSGDDIYLKDTPLTCRAPAPWYGMAPFAHSPAHPLALPMTPHPLPSLTQCRRDVSRRLRVKRSDVPSRRGSAELRQRRERRMQ